MLNRKDCYYKKSKQFFSLHDKKSIVVTNNYILNIFFVILIVVFTYHIYASQLDNVVNKENAKNKFVQAFEFRKYLLSSTEKINSIVQFKSNYNLAYNYNQIHWDTEYNTDSISSIIPNCDRYSVYKNVLYNISYNGSCITLLAN